MGMHCHVCKKTPQLGNQKTYRGKAKYLGGVGKKITGITRRTYRPNLQSIRIANAEGKAVRARVCVACIRSGMIRKPVKRLPFSMQAL
jgi:large subunit ribosomal protein L28